MYVYLTSCAKRICKYVVLIIKSCSNLVLNKCIRSLKRTINQIHARLLSKDFECFWNKYCKIWPAIMKQITNYQNQFKSGALALQMYQMCQYKKSWTLCTPCTLGEPQCLLWKAICAEIKSSAYQISINHITIVKMIMHECNLIIKALPTTSVDKICGELYNIIDSDMN